MGERIRELDASPKTEGKTLGDGLWTFSSGSLDIPKPVGGLKKTGNRDADWREWWHRVGWYEGLSRSW